MRVLLGFVAALVLLGSALVTATRFLASGNRYLATLAALSPYAVLGFAVVLLGCLLALALRSRGRALGVLVLVAVVGVAAQASWLVPRFVADDQPAGGGPRLRMMTANLQFGNADAATVLRAVRRERLDLLVLEELTPPELARLDSGGLRRLLPNTAGRPAYTAQGTMVFSRLPLSGATTFPLANVGVAVTVGTAGRSVGAFRLLASHTAQPVDNTAAWVQDLATLREQTQGAVAAGPTVLAGDLNATVDHRLLRRVLHAGLTDAVDDAGSGWQPTWPSAYRFSWTRPVVAIDHVLTSRQLVAVRTRTVALPGSDHRGLVADLVRR